VLWPLFWLQAALYALGFVSGRVAFLQRRSLPRIAHFFTMVQWAMLLAWGKWAMGQQQVTWEPSKRNDATQVAPPVR
jgi:hypothetical protein